MATAPKSSGSMAIWLLKTWLCPGRRAQVAGGGRRYLDEIAAPCRAGRVAEVQVELVKAVRGRNLILLYGVVEALAWQCGSGRRLPHAHSGPGNREPAHRSGQRAVGPG